MLYVDQRWRGTHGIGRFATEVGNRLGVVHNTLPAAGNPSSPLDAIAPSRMGLSSRDIVYSPGFNAGMTAATQLLTLHDLIHLRAKGPKAMLLRLYYERVVKPAVVKAGAVFTVSTTSATAIREWLGAADVNIVNVGNGCSDVFTESIPAAVVPSYFLYVGNLKRHKNFDVVLQALLRRPDYTLIAVINEKALAEQKVASLGLAGRVKVVTGLCDADLANYYRNSLGLLMPSLIEGFGLPAVESLACGRPVAYSRVCLSVGEIVGDYGVGVEDATRAEGWADAMDELVSLSVSFNAPGASWRDQYRWNQVASKVDAHLALLQNV